MIFEAVLQGKDAEIGIGSIAGGGRYDNLIGMFSQN
jgi:histidyl-tRNA synthetase